VFLPKHGNGEPVQRLLVLRWHTRMLSRETRYALHMSVSG
jgi:hypothetical protein